MSETEFCDDGNTVPGDGCSADCSSDRCVYDLDALGVPIALPPESGVRSMVFGFDCDLFLGTDSTLGNSDGIVYRVDAQTGVVSEAIDFSNPDTTSMAFDPLAQVLYISNGYNPVIYSWDENEVLTEVGELPVPYYQERIQVVPPGWGDYGGYIAGVVSNGGRGITVMDPETGDTTDVTPELAPNVTLSHMQFAPDGTLFAAAESSGVIYTVSVDGDVAPLVSFPHRVSAFGLTTLGDRIVVPRSVGFQEPQVLSWIHLDDLEYEQSDAAIASFISAEFMRIDGGDNVFFKDCLGNDACFVDAVALPQTAAP